MCKCSKAGLQSEGNVAPEPRESREETPRHHNYGIQNMNTDAESEVVFPVRQPKIEITIFSLNSTTAIVFTIVLQILGFK